MSGKSSFASAVDLMSKSKDSETLSIIREFKGTTGPDGGTLLHYFVTRPEEGSVKPFKTEGYDINARDHNGLTPLAHACISKNASAINQLLKLNANPSLKDVCGNHCLHYAFKAKNSETVLKSLLRNKTWDGCNITNLVRRFPSPERYRSSLLKRFTSESEGLKQLAREAAEAGDMDSINYLFSCGLDDKTIDTIEDDATVDSTAINDPATNDDKEAKDFQQLLLFIALRRNDTRLVAFLVSRIKDTNIPFLKILVWNDCYSLERRLILQSNYILFMNMQQSRLQIQDLVYCIISRDDVGTAVVLSTRLACFQSYFYRSKAIDFIIEMRAFKILQQLIGVDRRDDKTGQTVLMRAAATGCLPTLCFLLEHMKEPEYMQTRDNKGRNALMHACTFNPTSVEIVTTLLNYGANIYERDAQGLSVLMYAVKSAPGELAQLLINYFCGSNGKLMPEDASQVLEYNACRQAHDWQLSMWLLYKGAIASSKAFLLAAKHSNWHALRIYLDSGAQCGSLKQYGFFEQYGANVLPYVATSGDLELFERVERCYEETRYFDSQPLLTRDNLMHAALCQLIEEWETIANRGKEAVLRHLVAQQVRPIVELNLWFSLPMHLASRLAQSRPLSIMLSSGAPTDCQDIHGNTPLHTAAKYLSLSCIKTLLDYKATTSMQNNKGDTPLHILAYQLRTFYPDPCIFFGFENAYETGKNHPNDSFKAQFPDLDYWKARDLIYLFLEYGDVWTLTNSRNITPVRILMDTSFPLNIIRSLEKSRALDSEDQSANTDQSAAKDEAAKTTKPSSRLKRKCPFEEIGSK